MAACTIQLAARPAPRHALTTSKYDSEGRLNSSGGSVPVMELKDISRILRLDSRPSAGGRLPDKELPAGQQAASMYASILHGWARLRITAAGQVLPKHPCIRQRAASSYATALHHAPGLLITAAGQNLSDPLPDAPPHCLAL